MDKEKIIHLLILVESSHDAEVLASTFRNAGYAVRSKHVEDEEDLLAAIQDKAWDLLIAAPQVGDYTSVKAMECIKAAGKDIPCIVFGPITDNQVILENMRGGAAYCVPAEEQELHPTQYCWHLGLLHWKPCWWKARNETAPSSKVPKMP